MARKSHSAKLKFRAFLRRLAKEFGYKAAFDRAPRHAVLQAEGFPITICCDQVGTDSIFVYLFIRTTSWDFEGERTDLHDALSVLVCSFLRCLPNGVSSRIWDIPHPAVDAPETEVYARYVTFEQPFGSLFSLDTEGYEKLVSVLKVILTFRVLLPRMIEMIKDESKAADLGLYDFQGTAVRRWATTVAAALKQRSGKSVQFNLRRNPCWLYYRKLRPTVSVLYSPRLIAGLRLLMKDGQAWETVRGDKGELFVSKDVKNSVAFATQDRITKILRTLRDTPKHGGVQFIPLENYCVAVGTTYMIFVKSDCGRDKFEREKTSLSSRHLREARLLFPPERIIWKPKIDDAAFEELIRDLLRREPGVRWVKKMGHTNEPEGGRDLIVEWDTPPVAGQVLEEGSSPVIRRRVIVQCKASTHAVGKTDVRDIHDLLKRFDASGFFLAVSSNLTVGLIEHLEKLRYGNDFWSDWWERIDIEERLTKNESVAVKYPSVVSLHSGVRGHGRK
jgi:hypothetical protein